MANDTPVALELGFRRGEAEGREPADGAPVQPLASALASGHARFAGSPVRGLAPGSTRGIRRLSAKVEVIFGGFAWVAITGHGVEHTAGGGLPFVEAIIGGRSYLLGCGTIPGRPLVPGMPVEVVTGMCLFGADSVLGWAAGGPEPYPMTVGPGRGLAPAHPIEEVTADPRWHVYEAETLGRIGSFILALAGLGGQGWIRVSAHVPGPEYELFGLSLYAQGLLPGGWCERYRETVRARAAMVAQALQDCLGSAAQVTATSPMAFLGRVDTGTTAPGQVLRQLYEAARAQGGLWEALLEGHCPSFRNLIYASYVHHYLTTAAAARQGGHQVLLAENPDEEKIFRHARAHGARAGVPLDDVTGCYVHPQVVVTHTAFPGAPRLLHECRNGSEPRTVAAATRYYWPAGFRLRPGGRQPRHPPLAAVRAPADTDSLATGGALARLAIVPEGRHRVHSMGKSAIPGARRLSHDQTA